MNLSARKCKKCSLFFYTAGICKVRLSFLSCEEGEDGGGCKDDGRKSDKQIFKHMKRRAEHRRFGIVIIPGQIRAFQHKQRAENRRCLCAQCEERPMECFPFCFLFLIKICVFFLVELIIHQLLKR